MDKNTLFKEQDLAAKMEREGFARVSVEKDLNKRLPSRFVIRRQVFIVMYEGLTVICFHYGKYGHRKESCPLAKRDEDSV